MAKRRNTEPRFGQRFRAVREAQGMTAADVAAKVRRSRQWVAALDDADSVTLRTLYRLADALGVEPRELLP